MIVDVTISCHSFMFSQSRAKVSAGFTNVSDLAVAAFDLAYCSLQSVLQSPYSYTLTRTSIKCFEKAESAVFSAFHQVLGIVVSLLQLKL